MSQFDLFADCHSVGFHVPPYSISQCQFTLPYPLSLWNVSIYINMLTPLATTCPFICFSFPMKLEGPDLFSADVNQRSLRIHPKLMKLSNMYMNQLRYLSCFFFFELCIVKSYPALKLRKSTSDSCVPVGVFSGWLVFSISLSFLLWYLLFLCPVGKLKNQKIA